MPLMISTKASNPGTVPADRTGLNPEPNSSPDDRLRQAPKTTKSTRWETVEAKPAKISSTTEAVASWKLSTTSSLLTRIPANKTSATNRPRRVLFSFSSRSNRGIKVMPTVSEASSARGGGAWLRVAPALFAWGVNHCCINFQPRRAL